MDPDKCWYDLRFNMDRLNYAEARQNALDLREWLNKGGAFPFGFTEETVKGYIISVLQRTEYIQ